MADQNQNNHSVKESNTNNNIKNSEAVVSGNHQNNHRHHSGQYKRQSNQQYGNGYNGYPNTQRRYNNNNNNNYNYNFRHYNNRRQFQQEHSDYFHHQNHQNYSNNHHNGYYHNRGGHNNRGRGGYAIHGSDSYHTNYRKGNPHHHHQMSYGSYEDSLPLPAKRANWSNSVGDNFAMNGNHLNGLHHRGSYSPNSRQCSPDTSPASSDSGFMPSGQNREIMINANGNIIAAQHLGPYDFVCGNMENQLNGGTNAYSYYSNLQQANYFYNNYGGGGSNNNHESRPTDIPSIPNATTPTLGLLVADTDANSSLSESCTTDSTPSEKTIEWPDCDSSDGSDSESVPTSVSTRCPSSEDLDDLPGLTKETSFRLYNDLSELSKEGFSPNGSFCMRLQKRQFSFPREWFEDLEPEEIVRQFSKAGEVKEKPTCLVEGNNKLDDDIWTKFFNSQQTTDTFRKKVELWRDIYRLVRYMNFAPGFKQDTRNFPTFGIQVVGSTMSGFGSNSSDVDMCLVIRDSEVDQRFEAVDRLQTLSRTLQMLPCVENPELIYAKVPILKFRDASRRFDVDLNCNNYVGIRNTHLLYAYAQMDWRLKPLVLNVKLWAQFHRINDAKNMTISSYSLVLMVIHFLQCGVEEPVLPVLHKVYPERFNNTNPILSVNIHETMPTWESKNQMGLGELLVQFLEYYARKFDYSRNAVSVRMGGTVTIKTAANHKSIKNDFHQWKYLCVEEPFDRTNTARSVYDRDIFERIILIFYCSWQRLQVTQDLDSIFTPICEVDLRAISTAIANNRIRS